MSRTQIRTFCSMCFSALLLCTANSAFAFGDGGHMIVAKIAYDRISAENPRAKSEIDRLLAVPVAPFSTSKKTKDFVSASTWADSVKTLTGFQETADQHFIDYPFAADKSPLPGDLPKEVNIVKALDEFVADLKGTDTDDATKAAALRYVIHFVGDIHQPLHCETRVTSAHLEGDRGGNDFKISTRLQGKKVTITLHSYWDRGIGTFPSPGANFALPPLVEITKATNSIIQKYTLDPKWKVGGPYNYKDWAKESNLIATSFAYNGLKENAEPNANYTARAIEIAQYRVLVAGNRLATLLEAIWP